MSDRRREAIERIVKLYGTWRAAGAALGVDHSYLYRISRGQKNPSEEMMLKLNLRREIHYEWRKP